MWDSYPIPHMDECIESLGNATIFSTWMLIAAAGKWKLPTKMAINLLTNSITDFSHPIQCHFIFRAHLRHSNSQGVSYYPRINGRSHSFMSMILKYFLNFQKNENDHGPQILTVLNDAEVTNKLRKCDFFTKRIDDLKHVIKPGGLGATSTALPTIISSIRNAAQRQIVNESHSTALQAAPRRSSARADTISRWPTRPCCSLTLSKSAADIIAVKAYSRLLPRAHGPHQVIWTTLHTVTIEQDRIVNKISSEHVVLVPNSMPP